MTNPNNPNNPNNPPETVESLLRGPEGFPEAPRVAMVRVQTGQAVWNVRWTVCGMAVAQSEERGRSGNEVLTFRMHGESYGEELRATSREGWEAAKVAHAQAWLASGKKAAFLKACSWGKDSPDQARLEEILRAAQKAAQTTGFQAERQGERIWLKKNNEHAGGISVDELEGLEGIIGTSPQIRIECFEKTHTLPIHAGEPEIRQGIETAARSTAAGRALIFGEKPDWKVEGVRAQYEVIDEWAETGVEITISGESQLESEIQARAWVKENTAAILAKAPQAPAPNPAFEGDGIDSPKPGTRFPTPEETIRHPEEIGIGRQKITLSRSHR